MQSNEILILSQVSKRKGVIILITSFVLLLTLIFSLFQPLKYSASISLLIIQTGDVNYDIYSASRSAERVADSLSQLVYTSTFFDKVMNSGYDVSRSSFDPLEYKRRQEWARTVETQVKRGTGILQIIVYDGSQYKAGELANAVADVLAKQGQEYIGSSNVSIKIVDNVLVSRYPVKPNFVLNAFLGILIGAIIGISYVALSPNATGRGKKKRRPIKIIENVEEEEALESAAKKRAEIETYSYYPEEEIDIMPKTHQENAQ
ncbi:MAG TPA: hypothetical protein VMX18_01670 [Candidatus Bipolaricaulota bacterium]|nr:hypothetical protein [Candidatus Bipolaricaulota bacterium]